jgi:spermidine synthase
VEVVREESQARSSPNPSETSQGVTRLFRAELFASVFSTGATVILIEILGTRVIGPVFGVSLFVWSALLAVTLGSLATGYHVGGLLADRAPSQRIFGLAVATAGVLLCVVPLLSHVVLQFAEAMGPRAGSLFAATLLFAPCLVVLGTMGPIAVRLTASDFRSAGRGVGAVYAMSTAGSLVGALVTGFVLVPAFETDTILFGAAALLILMGAGSLARRRQPLALAAIVTPILAVLLQSPPALPRGIAIIAHSQSLYGRVEVIDDQNRQVRFLRVDHSVVGAQFLRDRSSGFAFIHLLEVVRFLRPDAKELLQIGLGTGALPSVLAPHAIKIDVVEIDPAVVRFARQYFGFVATGDVYEEDARVVLRRTRRRYDIVVHDTFTGGTTPEHLLSLEVLREIHSILRPGGVLALNFVGYTTGPNAEASWAVTRTLRGVFTTVHAFQDANPADNPDSPGNVIFFASDDPLDFTIPESVRFENAACRHVMRSFGNWRVLEQVPDGPLITDEHNPLARLQLPIAEKHFQAMNKLLPVDLWLQ